MTEKTHETHGRIHEKQGAAHEKTPHPAGTLPRVVPEDERAVEGTTRYLIHAVTAGAPINRLYILARKDDEASAVKLYMDTANLPPTRTLYDADPTSATQGTVKTVPVPVDLDVQKLPD
jgi:hypothetical protein